MKKYLILVVVLLLIIVGFYLIKNNNVKKESLPQENFTPSDSLKTGNLKIIESKISYSVDKIFLKKPVEKVIGITSEISGNINYENNLISGDLVIPTSNLTTGQNKRDEDVREILGDKIKVQIKEQEVVFPLASKIPVSIIIGDKVNEVVFDTTIKDEDNTIYFSGNSKISMKSFGIEAPSMLNVYQVSDEVDLFFELKAEK